MKLERITYGPIQAGSMAGIFAVEVELGNRLDCSTVEALDRTLRALEFAKPKNALLLLNCLNAKDQPADEIGEYIGTLRDQGFIVVGLIPGIRRLPYIAQFNRIHAVIYSPDWLGYTVQELHYFTKTLQPEPRIAQNNATCLRYLMLEGKVPADQLFDWLQKAAFAWAVDSPGRVYQLDLLEVK